MLGHRHVHQLLYYGVEGIYPAPSRLHLALDTWAVPTVWWFGFHLSDPTLAYPRLVQGGTESKLSGFLYQRPRVGSLSQRLLTHLFNFSQKRIFDAI